MYCKPYILLFIYILWYIFFMFGILYIKPYTAENMFSFFDLHSIYTWTGQNVILVSILLSVVCYLSCGIKFVFICSNKCKTVYLSWSLWSLLAQRQMNKKNLRV